MSYFFIESSALIKLFVQEPGSQPLIDLLDPVEDNRKLIASIASVEVRSAIRRRQRSGDLTDEHTEIALEQMLIHCSRMIEQPAQPLVLEAARDLVDRHGLRTLDAIQLGSCLVGRDLLGCTDMTFLCSDQKLLQAAAQENLLVLDPESL
jgi:predicted nucleic acid-binding protein